MDKVRCPACRGAKKVIKLGGMMGDCSTCEGTGTINTFEKLDFKPVPQRECQHRPSRRKKKVKPTRSVDNGNVQCASTDTGIEAKNI